MGKAWKTFKSKLITEYVNKDRTPCMKYRFVSSDTSDAFVQMKTTAEFQQQSTTHKAIQAQNTHPHRLSNAGYAGKIPQWMSDDDEAIRSEVSPPFTRIANKRAQN